MLRSDWAGKEEIRKSPKTQNMAGTVLITRSESLRSIQKGSTVENTKTEKYLQVRWN